MFLLQIGSGAHRQLLLNRQGSAEFPLKVGDAILVETLSKLEVLKLVL